MKFNFFLFYIIIHMYNNEICEDKKTCYNCSISSINCSWSNNLCSTSNSELFKNNIDNIKSSFISLPFITSQYKCITNENDIEIFKEMAF